MSYRVYDGAAYSSVVDANEEALVSDINANPGTDEPGIVLRTGKPALLVSELLGVLVEKRIVTRAYDASGVPFYWTAGEYAVRVWSRRADARNWLAANSGKTVTQMAASLGVHEAIALALAEGLRAEGKAKLVPV
ncbi:MAG: hypothetical protein OHK0028_22800 [Deltaproteobacteria bacterium]